MLAPAALPALVSKLLASSLPSLVPVLVGMGQRSWASGAFGSYCSSSAGKVICKEKNKSFVPVGTGPMCVRKRGGNALQLKNHNLLHIIMQECEILNYFKSYVDIRKETYTRSESHKTRTFSHNPSVSLKQRVKLCPVASTSPLLLQGQGSPQCLGAHSHLAFHFLCNNIAWLIVQVPLLTFPLSHSQPLRPLDSHLQNVFHLLLVLLLLYSPSSLSLFS